MYIMFFFKTLTIDPCKSNYEWAPTDGTWTVFQCNEYLFQSIILFNMISKKECTVYFQTLTDGPCKSNYECDPIGTHRWYIDASTGLTRLFEMEYNTDVSR